ncbi:MAG: hypothetical protein ACHQ2Z_13575 [Elusimicrobiota bacterium]
MEAVLIVSGASMGYLFGSGDRVRFSSVEPESLRLGDIIVFLHPEPGRLFLIHRLVWKTGSGERLRFWTKPDAAFHLDAPLSRVNVVGRVTAFEPSGGRWIELDSAGARAKHVLIGLFSNIFFRYEPKLRLKAVLNAIARPAR